MVFKALLDKQTYQSGIGRLKGRPAKSGDQVVGSVSTIDMNAPNGRVEVSLNVQDHFVELAQRKGVKVEYTFTGGMWQGCASNIVLTPVDVQKQVYEMSPKPPITHVSHGNPAFSHSPLQQAYDAANKSAAAAQQFKQEYLGEFVPEPPPPAVLLWEKMPSSSLAQRFEVWVSTNEKRFFFGATLEEAVGRAITYLQGEDHELWKSPEIIRARDYTKAANIKAMGSSPSPLSLSSTKHATPAGWVPTPISGPAKAKYIIVEPQEVRPRADSDPDPRKPWTCRPEGQIFPVAEGDTPEEAVEMLKLLNESLEPLDFVVVGGGKSSSGARGSVGPRVERSLEV